MEDRQPAQRPPLGLAEQVPGPVDDGDQGLVPVGRAAVAAAQQREPVVEPPVDVVDRHRPAPWRRPARSRGAARRGGVRRGVRRRPRAVRRGARPTRAARTGRPRRPRRAGASGKTRSAAMASGARVVVTTRSWRHDATRKATSSATASTTCSQLSRIRSVGAWSRSWAIRAADVVALLGGEHPAAADRVAYAERGADLADDVLGRGDADQLDEVDDRLLGLAAEQVREPGLAEPARPEDRGDPRLADGGPQRPDVLVAADQRRRLEPQPLADRAVRRQQLGVDRLQGRPRVDAEPVGEVLAVPLVALQRRRGAVHGGRGAQQRGDGGLVALRPSRGAAAPPGGRPARTAPGRAPSRRSRGAGPRSAAARRAVPRRRCRARACASAARARSRARTRSWRPSASRAPTTASRSTSASTRVRGDRAGSRGRSGRPPRARSATGRGRPRPGAPWPGWPARRPVPRPPRPAAPRRPGRRRPRARRAARGSGRPAARCPARTPRRAAGATGSRRQSLHLVGTEPQPRRGDVLLRGARRCRCRGSPGRARPARGSTRAGPGRAWRRARRPPRAPRRAPPPGRPASPRRSR